MDSLLSKLRKYEESPREKITDRKNLIGLTLILWGWAIHSSDSVIGASIANAAPLKTVLIGTLIGGLLIVLNVFLGGYIGYKTGYPVNQSSQVVFGKKGYFIPNFLTVITLTGWAGYSIGLTSEFFARVVNIPDKYYLLATISFSLLFGLFAGIGTAFFGTRFIELVSFMSSPAIIILLMYMAIQGVTSAGGWGVLLQSDQLQIGWSITTGQNPLLWIIGLTFTSWISIGLYSSDYFRFAKRWQDVLIAGAFSYMFGKVLVQLLGAVSARALGITDIFEIFIVGGIAIIGFIAYIFDSWTSADAQLYSSGLAISNIFNLKRILSTLVITGVAILVAILGIYKVLFGFLLFVGILVGPILGPVYADYYIVRKWIADRPYSDFSESLGIPNYRLSAIISWLIGVIVAYNYNTIGLMGVNGILAAFFSYLALEFISTKLTKKV